METTVKSGLLSFILNPKQEKKKKTKSIDDKLNEIRSIKICEPKKNNDELYQ